MSLPIPPHDAHPAGTPATAPGQHASRADSQHLQVSPSAVLERVLFEVKRVVVGQDLMVERMLVALVARGHLLLEGVPGVAKTLAVRTLAAATGGTFHRLQFTPDLMPGDIVGTRVWRPSTESFDVELGPVFAHLVLADEINRAPAKVQSALLEAMAERQVSIGGRTYRLPDPFLVLATQNPVESEGVHVLPEAQRDRFLMKVDVGYPSDLEEMTILQRMSVDPPAAGAVLDAAGIVALQQAADRVFVHHAVARFAVDLVMATREPERFDLFGWREVVEYGVSPRATLGLVAAARGLALLRGRDYVLPIDVADVAGDVLCHRLVLTFDATADGIGPREVVDRLLLAVPRPRVAPHEDTADGVPGAA
ncbi:AAA domain-containing protein [Nakamurella sp. YIM 132087]|uniref:AAA domain-containing protein n=1 Tax=Nakamurella alba TaxID=2665158 RepID=A0A7K1FGI9_9ACTN|nr:MoxR family ATPase [Nakamurella alba]MTD13231.1 AAA domain-containing protein [Nakamurella alba]